MSDTLSFILMSIAEGFSLVNPALRPRFAGIFAIEPVQAADVQGPVLRGADASLARSSRLFVTPKLFCP
jgi:hypothetical protein